MLLAVKIRGELPLELSKAVVAHEVEISYIYEPVGRFRLRLSALLCDPFQEGSVHTGIFLLADEHGSSRHANDEQGRHAYDEPRIRRLFATFRHPGYASVDFLDNALALALVAPQAAVEGAFLPFLFAHCASSVPSSVFEARSR